MGSEAEPHPTPLTYVDFTSRSLIVCLTHLTLKTYHVPTYQSLGSGAEPHPTPPPFTSVNFTSGSLIVGLTHLTLLKCPIPMYQSLGS